MAEGNVEGGYRSYGVESHEGDELYRVPDLLTQQQLIDYMLDVYNATVTVVQN